MVFMYLVYNPVLKAIWHFLSVYYNTSQYPAHIFTANRITLHYITLHYITLHYITLHYITLHYITLTLQLHRSLRSTGISWCTIGASHTTLHMLHSGLSCTLKSYTWILQQNNSRTHYQCDIFTFTNQFHIDSYFHKVFSKSTSVTRLYVYNKMFAICFLNAYWPTY